MGPIELIILQTTALCNLDCRYCYISADERKQSEPFSLEFVEPVFSKLLTSRLACQQQPIQIVWHAGEPLLLPISYYESFIETVERINENLGDQCLDIRYGLQTNGLRVDSAWCGFFRKYGIEVGISCDGPSFLHDQYRRHWNGAPSHHEVQKAIHLFQDEGIPVHLLTTVTPETLDYPEEFFHFLIENKVKSVGLNFVRKIGAHETEYLESHLERCQSFIQRLFHFYSVHRLSHPGQHLRIREFEGIVTLLTHPDSKIHPDSLTAPFKTISIDRKGNLSTFDPQLLSTHNHHHPDEHFLFGNLLTDEIEAIINNAKLQQVNSEIQAGIALCKEQCEYFEICHASLPAEKYCENGTFNSAETVQCTITKKITGHAILDDFQARLAEEQEGYELTRQAIMSAKPAPPELPLLPGIQIVADEHCEPVSIRLSQGTETKFSSIQQRFIWVPKMPWEAPSEEASSILFAPKGREVSNQTIGVWQLPDPLYQQIYQAIVDLQPETKGREILQTDLGVLQVIDTIQDYVIETFNAKPWLHELYTVGVDMHFPGAQTATKDYMAYLPHNPFVGLHVDHWDKQPPYLSGNARNRLVINVGSEPRYFLYVNLTLTQLLGYIGDTEITPKLLEYPTRIAQRFMEKYPEYPVIRLQLNPGQAYIAPTEILIHDATTEDKQAMDYSLTFLGRFSLNQTKQLNQSELVASC